MKKFALLLALLCAFSTKAADIYFGPVATGSNNGTSCANAYAYTDVTHGINVAGNWVAGNTLHVCGTWTGGAAAHFITAAGSGTALNPITIKFETGAGMTSAYCGGGGVGCILLNNFSYIVVDGGTPCGTTTGGVPSVNSCNGTIQNTDNGVGASCPNGATPPNCTYHAASYAIEMSTATTTNIEIKNLACINIYPSIAGSGDGNQQVNQCVHLTSSVNTKVHDSLFHDCGWCIGGWADGYQIYNNNIYNMDHGLAFGNGNSNVGYLGTSGNLVTVHDNHFGAMVTWDNANLCCHHDAIHFWAGQGGTGAISGVTIYNNTFDGDPGAQWQADFYGEQGIQNFTVFNNLSNRPVTRTSQAQYIAGNKASGATSAGNDYFLNNTMIGEVNNANGAGVINIGAAGGTSVTNDAVINNAITGGAHSISYGSGTDTGTTPCTTIPTTSIPCQVTNVYEATGSFNQFGFHGNNTGSFTTWKTGASYLNNLYGADAGSSVISFASMLINADGSLQAASPLRSAGTNLTALCTGYISALCSDIYGRGRPSGSTAWDVGAVQYAVTGPAVTFSPTSVAFGNVPVNTSATPQSITLTNTGTASLTISSMSIIGVGASVFGFSTSPASNCGGTMAASASCTITFTFLPTAVQAYSVNFSMSDNATGSPHTVPLTGTGTGAIEFLNPASINFGTYLVGNSVPYTTVTLQNSGNITMTGISVVNNDTTHFNLIDSGAGSCSAAGNVLAAGASCTVQVNLQTALPGTFSSSLTVSSSATNSPMNVTMNGTVLAVTIPSGCLFSSGILLSSGVSCR